MQRRRTEGVYSEAWQRKPFWLSSEVVLRVEAGVIFQGAGLRWSDGERLRRRWPVTGVALLISAPRPPCAYANCPDICSCAREDLAIYKSRDTARAAELD